MDNVIRVEEVSKLYRLGVISSRTIAQDINRFILRLAGKENPDFKIGAVNDRELKNGSQVVWALRNVNFKVNSGDVLAVIGKNGAGKSTLLKILSRVTSPTNGSVKIRGRVASLLEVGTGFHQELTGRENVYLNGSILGMTRNEIKRKFDEIVEFSGIGNYIDTPVKRYSSGMHVRLAFAVAAHLEPEILIVDEVLAVGDADFQRKCIGKMQDVSKREGRTVLFVSHNMAAVKNLCTRGLILEHGTVTYDGDVENCVSRYLSSGFGGEEFALRTRTDRVGGDKFRFVEMALKGANHENLSQIISGEKLSIELEYETFEELSGNIIAAVHFVDGFGNTKASFVTDEMGVRIDRIEKKGKLTLEIPRLLLRADSYAIRLFASLNTTRTENVLDTVENVAKLTVLQGDFWKTGKLNRGGNYGLMDAEFLINQNH
jgi:lipopolysaccharide transport system ATP-binding protein